MADKDVAPQFNSYDAYGIPAATNIGRFSYTGQAYLPEIGLMYYKARMYSPYLGLARGFDSPDQILILASHADRPHRL